MADTEYLSVKTPIKHDVVMVLRDINRIMRHIQQRYVLFLSQSPLTLVKVFESTLSNQHCNVA